MIPSIKKLTQVLVLAGMSSSVILAQSTGSVNTSSTSAVGNFYDSLKESPLSLSLLVEVGTIRESDKDLVDYGEVKGTSLLYFPSLAYKFNDNNSLSFNGYWIKNFERNEASDTEWTYSQLNYTRSGLLNEADHGVNLSLLYRQRVYPENLKEENKENRGIAGYSRPGFSVSKTLTENLSLSWSSHLAVYNRVSGNDEQPLYYLYTYPVLSYSINDKFSVYTLWEYFRNELKGDSAQNTEILTVTLGTEYGINKVITVGAYVAGNLMQSHDGNFINSELAEETTLTGTVNFNIF